MKNTIRLLALLGVLAAPAALAETQRPAVELKVSPDRTAVNPASNRDTILQIEVDAKPSATKRKIPLNLALVLDRSGSMAGAKLEKARQAACVAVDQLREDDIFSLVIYDNDVELLIPPQKTGDKDKLKATINAIEPGGGTALYAGVEAGIGQLRKFLEAERVNRVILLSDGLANVGPSSPQDLARLGKTLRRDEIGVSTVGLGDDYNEDLMTALAEASRANYYYVKDAEKLPGIFTEELGTAQGITARKVRIRLHLAAGVEPGNVLGEDDLAFKDGALDIPIEDLSGGQKRRFLVACRVPERAEGNQALGKVTLEYVDADRDQSVRTSASADVRITTDKKAVDRSIVPDVAVNTAITRNRLSKEQAVRLADAGRAKDAAEVLINQAAANAALPAVAQSPLLQSENETLLKNASRLNETGTLSRAERKTIQYENYRDKKQRR